MPDILSDVNLKITLKFRHHHFRYFVEVETEVQKSSYHLAEGPVAGKWQS